MAATTPAMRPAAELKPWTPTFVLTVDDAVEQVDKKREFMRRVMKDGMHYGTIPGTPKPSLWKPGAELLLSAMGLHAELTDAASPTLDVTGRDHSGEPFIEYRRACTIWRQIGPAEHDRMVVARAEGSCSSWEVKYRYRDAKRRCPDCHEETIFASKKDGGWFCWRTKGGCGNTFTEDDRRITDQSLGRVKNPEVADAANTILKMADKRAFVAATLLATGCSDIFTQDLSDDEDDSGAAAGNDTPTGANRRTGGSSRPANGRSGGGSSLTAEQEAELRALNDALGEKKWSPPIFKAKASLGYEVAKAELEAITAAAPPPADPEAQS
jgi:hypothetical protein